MMSNYVFDAHCDTVNRLLDYGYGFEKNKGHLDVSKINQGGVKAQIFAIWVNPILDRYGYFKRGMDLYKTLQNQIFLPGYGRLVTSGVEMDSVISQEKVACWLFLEGGHVIENSIPKLRQWYNLGVRGMTLTHRIHTNWADSSGEPSRWDGLNKRGQEIVAEMEHIGMVIDVSHASDATVTDVLELVSKPIMASHSNARALCDIPRNLPDDLIAEIASRKGFIGVTFFPGFLDKTIYNQIYSNLKHYSQQYEDMTHGHEDNPQRIFQAEEKLSEEIIKGVKVATIDQVVEHIIHIIDVGNIDCVGLGSDFDGIPVTPDGLSDASCFPALKQGLLDQGCSHEDAQKIMSENLKDFFNKI
jgi:membrane dipeptidase